jgi:large subunit ribosomal protein L30
MQVKLVRSPNKRTPNQRRNLRALGLTRMNQVRNHADDPSVWGKIFKVKHLVEVKR